MKRTFLILNLSLSLIFTSCGGDTEVANETPEVQVGCTADHPSVGKSGEFSNLQHNVGGTLTVVSDCEVEITNFSFDGGGVNVRVYGATDENNFLAGYSLSDNLRENGGNGDPEFQETFSVFLPEGVTFDDVNAFSIWCVPFEASFGTVTLN